MAKIAPIFLLLVLGFASPIRSQSLWDSLVASSPTLNKLDEYGKAQGLWVLTFKDNKTKYLYHYKDDKLNGYSESFDSDGHLHSTGYYSDDVIDSIIRVYYPNGKLRYQENFDNGIRNGTSIFYHDNGTLHWKGQYVEGELEGEVIIYDRNGDTSTVYFYKDNRANGTAIKFQNGKKLIQIYDMGILQSEEQYQNNIRTQLSYFKEGEEYLRKIYFPGKPDTVEKEYYYENGELVKTVIYDENGNPVP